jgi:hypothetical protein
MFRPIEGLAATNSTNSIYSLQPCRYALHELMQDATDNSGMAKGNPVFAAQGSQYCVEMCWEPKIIHAGTDAAIGGMTFRANNDQNYYYLVFFRHSVAISRIRNNMGRVVKRVHRNINVNRPAMFELEMEGSTFSVRDTARSGHPTILHWTDSLNTSTHGNHLDHWTRSGVKACWEFVLGKPMG